MKTEPGQPPSVAVVGHSVAYAFGCHRSDLPDSCPDLLELRSDSFWSGWNVGVNALRWLLVAQSSSWRGTPIHRGLFNLVPNLLLKAAVAGTSRVPQVRTSTWTDKP